MQAAPTPLGVGMDKGKHKAFDDIEMDEGKKEGKEEAEACYVVRLDTDHVGFVLTSATTGDALLSLG